MSSSVYLLIFIGSVSIEINNKDNIAIVFANMRNEKLILYFASELLTIWLTTI